MFKLIFSLVIFCSISTSSFAYLGPGVGGGVIAAILGIVVAIFAALFGLIWFPVIDIIKSNLKIYQKILKLFSYKNVSDFRKEKLIFNYSKLLFTFSVKIFSILILILIFMYVQGLLFQSFLNLALTIFGIIELSIFVLIYHQLRKKINAKL